MFWPNPLTILLLDPKDEEALKTLGFLLIQNTSTTSKIMVKMYNFLRLLNNIFLSFFLLKISTTSVKGQFEGYEAPITLFGSLNHLVVQQFSTFDIFFDIFFSNEIF